MRQLIWKEWHEQGWKLAFGCIVVGAFALIGLRTRIISDEEMILWVCFPSMVLLPLLAAAGLVPAERAEGTFDALAALPISMRKIFAMKTITGVVLSAVPLLTAMAVSLAIAGGREMEAGRMAIIYLLCTLTSLSVFFWIFALTVRLPSEARAAMVGIGILMCWGMVTGWIVEEWRGANYSPPLECVSPFSFVLELNWPVRGAEVCIDCAVGTAIAAALSFGASRAISKETKTVE